MAPSLQSTLFLQLAAVQGAGGRIPEVSAAEGRAEMKLGNGCLAVCWEGRVAQGVVGPLESPTGNPASSPVCTWCLLHVTHSGPRRNVGLPR